MVENVWRVVPLVLGLGIASMGVAGCGGCNQASGDSSRSGSEGNPGFALPESMTVQVHRVHNHNPENFTQGLLWHGDFLYESTGLRGQSTLQRYRLGEEVASHSVSLDSSLFGEGLARVGSTLFQLTWTTGTLLRWNLSDFQAQASLKYEGEGWGLCFNGTHLVMSDGTDTLRFRNPETFEVVRRVKVLRGNVPVRRLNELECVGDDVYANIWQRDTLARIDAKTGRVLQWIDASSLRDRLPTGSLTNTDMPDPPPPEALNGIAFHTPSQHFLLTGKNWPRIFEVEFVAKSQQAVAWVHH